MSFIKDNFMLKSKTAEKLYHDYAEKLPIIDYHCHLSPKMIAEDYKFRNAYDLFLSGDHYKWRLMRAAGTDEKYITGKAEDYEKFAAFASVVPLMIGNPMFHWIHLEFKRYFGIDEILSCGTCRDIWEKCNSMLASDEFSAQSLIKKSNVEVVCTTDDPFDTLEHHAALKNFGVKILPTFRPDKAVEIGADGFNGYIEQTGAGTLDELKQVLDERIGFFAANGCRLSDHGMGKVPYGEGDADAVFIKRMNGERITEEEAEIYKTDLLKWLGGQYSKRGWTMQLHMGALRNNNSVMFRTAGPDSGFDSIGGSCDIENLSGLLDSLEKNGNLGKTILYSLNPNDNYALSAMAGNFQSSPVRGKIQLGSGWWFNDQRDGMENQMKALASTGLLSEFVGMLTDSRSFVSYTRHEYFRRIFCNILGTWTDEGEYPRDYNMLEKIVKGVCHDNAERYFGF